IRTLGACAQRFSRPPRSAAPASLRLRPYLRTSPTDSVVQVRGLARGDGVEAGERAQHIGHCESTVGFLVVLEQEYQRAAHRARGAIEGVHELRTALALHSCAEAARGIVAVVRAGRDLAVRAF